MYKWLKKTVLLPGSAQYLQAGQAHRVQRWRNNRSVVNGYVRSSRAAVRRLAASQAVGSGAGVGGQVQV